MSNTLIDGVEYRLVALEPNIVNELRYHAAAEGATCVEEFSTYRQRVIVQFALRNVNESTMPFCGPRGGAWLEALMGREEMLALSQGIADAHDIFQLSGARSDVQPSRVEGGETGSTDD